MQAVKQQVFKLIALIQRNPGMVAIFGFASGLASFLLVERHAGLAQVLALVMLVSWLWLILENILRERIAQWFGFELPPPLLRYATQMIHQESLFFVLPFFFITTTWNSGQLLFSGLLACAALISIIDPLYYRWLAPKRWLFLAYHTLALFAVLLTALPIIFKLTTPQSYQLALAAAVLLSFPSLFAIITVRRWWRGLLLVGMTLAIGAGGLFAYTAINAPRGLNERIYHVWRRDGGEVERIALDIHGGRKEGYRAWTHKQNFPEDAVGRWQVQVLTEAGQMIGVLRFKVVE